MARRCLQNKHAKARSQFLFVSPIPKNYDEALSSNNPFPN